MIYILLGIVCVQSVFLVYFGYKIRKIYALWELQNTLNNITHEVICCMNDVRIKTNDYMIDELTRISRSLHG